MKKARVAGIVVNVLLVFALLAGAYAYRAPLEKLLRELQNRALPCQQPIAYSLGTFDARFGIGRADFLKAAAQAAALWGAPVKKSLFVFSETGSLKINLVYDYRQEATAKLQKMGIAISEDEAGYGALKKKYDAMQASFAAQKAAFDASVAAYDQKKQSYDAEVAAANRRGGATPEEFARLEAERAALNADLDRVTQAQASLNEAVNTLNDVVTVLNRLAAALNKRAIGYNSVNAARGQTFEEGEYTSDASGDAVTIYQFDSRDKLVRVLAHELGHALGLDHSENSADIMYKLNQGTNEKLTANDVAALKSHCRL